MDINNIARKRTYIAHMRTTVTTDYTIALLADSDLEAEDLAQEAEPYDGRSVITQGVSLDFLEVENVSDAEYSDVIEKANAQIRERFVPIPMGEIVNDPRDAEAKYLAMKERIAAAAKEYIEDHELDEDGMEKCKCGYASPNSWIIDGICLFCGRDDNWEPSKYDDWKPGDDW